MQNGGYLLPHGRNEFGVNLSVVCSDNCHLQWERFLFSGNRSQLTPLVQYPSTDLIKKPAFNAYVLLSRLEDMRVAAVCEAAGYGRKFGVLPTIGKDVLSVMIWNFEDGMEDSVNTRRICLKISGNPFNGSYRLVHYRIDGDHSSSYNTWVGMGRPQHPTTEQVKKLRETEGLEMLDPVQTVEMQQEMNLEVEMPMHSVSLLLFVPENREKPGKTKIIKAVFEEGYLKNPQVFLKWQPNSEKDFLYYRIWRRLEGEEDFELICDNPSVNTAVYTDMDLVSGRRYFYSIQAMNASMVAGEMSEEAGVDTGS